MTVNSTVFGVVLIPLLLVFYTQILLSQGYPVDVPLGNIISTLIILLVPVAIGMLVRKINANWGAVVELGGGALGVFFIVFLLVSWVPRNWQFLMETSIFTFVGAVGLGVLGFLFGYMFSIALKLHPRNARTIALETGIQNGPLAIAIVALTISSAQQQATMAIPVLYSLFIVISSTLLTLWFRQANAAAEQKIPDQLM
jgi:BASS family bile acid:Na+ symporter